MHNPCQEGQTSESCHGNALNAVPAHLPYHCSQHNFGKRCISSNRPNSVPKAVCSSGRLYDGQRMAVSRRASVAQCHGARVGAIHIPVRADRAQRVVALQTDEPRSLVPNPHTQQAWPQKYHIVCFVGYGKTTLISLDVEAPWLHAHSKTRQNVISTSKWRCATPGRGAMSVQLCRETALAPGRAAPAGTSRSCTRGRSPLPRLQSHARQRQAHTAVARTASSRLCCVTGIMCITPWVCVSRTSGYLCRHAVPDATRKEQHKGYAQQQHPPWPVRAVG